MTPDIGLLTSVAARHGIPPAILYGVGQQASGFNDASLTSTDPNQNGKLGIFGLDAQTLTDYGFTAQEVSGNFALQAEIVARKLSQDYAQTGSWDNTLSLYHSNNADLSSSPTSSTGGWVNGVLAAAATNPTMGLNTMGMDAQTAHFAPMLTDFGNHLAQMAQAGGIVTGSHLDAYKTAVGRFTANHQGGSPSGPTMAVGSQASAFAGDYPAQTFSSHPFDAGFLGSETENFGMVPQGFSQEMGNDYGMPQGTALNAAEGGKLVLIPWAGKLDVGVRVSSGPWTGWTIGYGHSHSLADGLKIGDTVTAGQQIASSGGAVGDPLAGNSSGPHLEFQLIDPQGKWRDPQKVLQTTLGRQASMSRGSYGGGEAKPEQPAQPARQEKPRPDPHEIEKFSSQAIGLGLTPDHIKQNAESFHNLSRYYGLTGMDLIQFAKTNGMSQPEISAWLQAQPLPAYPGVQAGHFKQVYDTATLHSTNTLNRMPHTAEVARLAMGKAGDQQIAGYYQMLQTKETQRDNAGDTASNTGNTATNTSNTDPYGSARTPDNNVLPMQKQRAL